MKRLFYIFLLLLLFGCMKPTLQIKKKVRKKKNTIINLPHWFWELPNNDCVIGISFVESDIHRMIEAAKQDAAIQITKSKSAIIVSKRASLEYSDGDKMREVEYDIIGSKKLLRNSYNKLSLIESAILFNNYYIALFSTRPISKLKNNQISNKNMIAPNWFKKEGLEIKKKQILYFSKSTSHTLDKAFSKCLQKGRMSIGRYLKKEIKAMDKDNNTQSKRVFTQKTIKRLENISYQKNFISYNEIDGKMKYTVFMKIGAF
ncbi:MAG: hypothetical protein U9N34_02730 [Candidatus Cloacimonadota bacterium]|nr:hypothetical protein [Candidatus Cloacimonadota bacterium]